VEKQVQGILQRMGTCMGDCPVDWNTRDRSQDLYRKFASQVQKIAPYNPDFLYSRFRAIGCLEIDGPNNNWDGFPYEDFEDDRPNFGYTSFIGKKAFVEHQSHTVENSIGELPGAYLNRFIIPDQFTGRRYATLDSWDTDERRSVLDLPDQRDGSIEVLMAIDSKTSPRVARIIESGQSLGCSMGTNIAYSICTICGNVAHFEHQYCPHIKYAKGQTHIVPASDMNELVWDRKLIRPEWLPHVLSSQQDVRSVMQKQASKNLRARAFEVNRELSFFELSVVAAPAFNRAYMLERVASIQGIELVDFSSLETPELIALGISAGLIDLATLPDERLEELGVLIGIL